MIKRICFAGLILARLILIPGAIFGQSLVTGQEIKYNPIPTAVPFLTITPDSRHGAMGSVGVATSPDANSQYLNPSKYAFAEDKLGFAVSYTPWMRKLANDINLAYLSGYFRIDNIQAIGSSLRYFSMGDVTLTGSDYATLGIIRPNELAVDFSYSRKLSNYFSGGVALRYIRTDLYGGYGQGTYSAGNAAATDVSFFYNKKWESVEHKKTIAAGIDFSNIGSKISYNDGQTKEFLPANLRLGATFTNEIDATNSLSLSLDLNKLLVPTPSSKIITDDTGGTIILPENSSNEPVIESFFSSFSDASGGLKEELQEVTISTGVEYEFNNRFALRTGYFNESKKKGNRKFFTAGAGVKMNLFSLDFAYLMSTSQNNTLANTIRFTIIFNHDTFKKTNNYKINP